MVTSHALRGDLYAAHRGEWDEPLLVITPHKEISVSSSQFGKRGLNKPEAPLRAIIESESGVAWGFVENLTLDGLYVRLKRHNISLSCDRVGIELFLSASNGPSVFRSQARIVQAAEDGVALQFRPMTVSLQGRLKAIIAFVSLNQDPDRPSDPG